MATSIFRRGASLMANSSSVASSSRLVSTSATKPSARKKLASLEPIKTPTEFFNALAKPRRGDLSSISTLLGEEASWSSLDELSREKLKKAGVTIKERKYFLWAKEKFRQGVHPATFAIDIKPKKIVRGWGPRVQKGIRVRGRLRAGER